MLLGWGEIGDLGVFSSKDTLKKVIMEFLAKELLSLIMNMMQIAQMNILMLEK